MPTNYDLPSPNGTESVKMWRAAEVAAMYHLTERTVRRYASTGKWPCYTMPTRGGHDYLFSASDLVTIAAMHREPRRPEVPGE